MTSTRAVMDKSIGAAAIAVLAAIVVALVWCIAALLAGPSAARRLAGLIGIGVLPLAAVAAGYVGSHLLRYPPERRSTAAEIRHDAEKNRAPLSYRWDGRSDGS